MTHERAREALEALALDALDASEREGVTAHVAACAECQRELAALQVTASELALAAPAVPMPPPQRDRIRARLLARAAVDRASQPDSSDSLDAPAPRPRIEASASARAEEVIPFRASRRGMGAAAWMAMAAGLVAIVGVGGYLRASRERDALRASLQAAQAERGARLAALDSLRTTLDDKDRMIANLTGPQVAVMTLASQSPASPTGRMFWDQAHNAWTFVAHRVPMPKSGRTYQMWLVTPTAKISAGTFMPKSDGEVMMQATYAMPKDSLAAVAVTDEPMGGSAQPTTAPMMLASAR